MNYVKLTSKGDYYDLDTEVFNYDGNRFTFDEFVIAINDNCLLCRGKVDGLYDGDLCSPDEFTFEIVTKNKNYE